ncbi:MAG: YybH family protein [Ginsengibacter sp.]
MRLSRSEILNQFDSWLNSWNNHDLVGVMHFMHDNIFFENWNGSNVSGKELLKKSWERWFENHGHFKFSAEDLFIDEQEQKIAFSWKLEWPSLERKYLGQSEIRRGMDILHLENGKIRTKITYSKTVLQINNRFIALFAE